MPPASSVLAALGRWAYQGDLLGIESFACLAIDRHASCGASRATTHCGLPRIRR
ncbi:hypothetical protein C7S16_1476 [Burkholderia thailandensis]|uniref:Uncharacterized protein n=1 Tax=Burkholderia thailandensis TaxID=57975 RepID=A0AAW9D6M9_BURTH|nr:hypothetical protein [Burkholderia thailandensis]MDW9257437.1 hypothetical protein [Burkholderia thailandensis]